MAGISWAAGFRKLRILEMWNREEVLAGGCPHRHHAKTSSHLWSKWIREQHRERHLTLLTLTPVHCVVVWGSALPPHYLLSCRKTGDRLLYLSTSHLTDGGAGTLSPQGLQRAGYAGARIRIIRIITSSKNNPEARFYITHHRWEIKMGTSKHSEIISNFLPPTW